MNSYVDLLNRLHWKPVSRLCFERQLLLFHRYVHGTRFIPEEVLTHRPDVRFGLRGHVRHHMQREISSNVYQSPAQHNRQRQTVGNLGFYFGLNLWNAQSEDTCTKLFNEFKRHIRKEEFYESAISRLRNTQQNPMFYEHYNEI